MEAERVGTPPDKTGYWNKGADGAGGLSTDISKLLSTPDSACYNGKEGSDGAEGTSDLFGLTGMGLDPQTLALLQQTNDLIASTQHLAGADDSGPNNVYATNTDANALGK